MLSHSFRESRIQGADAWSCGLIRGCDQGWRGHSHGGFLHDYGLQAPPLSTLASLQAASVKTSERQQRKLWSGLRDPGPCLLILPCVRSESGRAVSPGLSGSCTVLGSTAVLGVTETVFLVTPELGQVVALTHKATVQRSPAACVHCALHLSVTQMWSPFPSPFPPPSFPPLPPSLLLSSFLLSFPPFLL